MRERKGPAHARKSRRVRPLPLVVAAVLIAVAAVCLVAIPGSATNVPHSPKIPGWNRSRTSGRARIVTPGRNLPDPFILHIRDRYYMYTSQTGLSSPPISLTVSDGNTIYSWGPTRAVLDSVSPLAENGFSWAPDVRYIDGRYVMYFNAWADKSIYFNSAETGLGQRAQCLWTATSPTPEGPFHPDTQPLLCQLKLHGDIDPRSFLSPSNQLWLIWKSDDNAFQPARPTYIWSQRLSSNGLQLVGQRYQLLAGVRNSWSGGLVEAPDLVHAAHKYWLFFSGNWFNGAHYAIGLALCKGPEGPCHAIRSYPWLAANRLGLTPGEESLFSNADGWWIAFSPHTHGSRPVAVAPVVFRKKYAFIHGLG